MYSAASLAGIVLPALGSMMIGAFLFSSIEQTYGQANMTEMTGANMTETAANMTTSSNMTATDTSTTTTTTAVPTPEVLMQKLNTALDDVLGKVRQQDPDAQLSKVECTIDSSWNVQCTISWRPAKGGQVSATNLNSSRSNIY